MTNASHDKVTSTNAPQETGDQTPNAPRLEPAPDTVRLKSGVRGGVMAGRGKGY